jgi:hypothetical protein
MTQHLRFLLIALLALLGVIAPLHAQDVTQEPQPTPLQVSLVEPVTFTSGTGGALSIYGQGFTSATTVRLVGFGLLTSTFINSGALTAQVPPGVGAGGYGVEVTDPVGGSARAPQTITVNPVPVTAPPPPPTFEPPTAVPTLPPPTPVPGQPSLVVRSFSASPASIPQGGTTTFTFEIINQGNRAALGVAVSLAAESNFSPANGQAGLILPDIPPNAVISVSLSVVAGRDATVGPNDVGITMSYRDFEGKTFTSNAILGVEVEDANLSVQLVITRYEVTPTPAAPGQPVEIRMTLFNMGSERAGGVMVRLTGEGSLLIPGSSGDAFIVGDLAAGASTEVIFGMIVKSDARRGPQPQPVQISYLQGGESQQLTSTIGLDIAAVNTPQPVILLESFSSGATALTPGMRFTLEFTLKNVGQSDATDMLVTFGSMDVSSNPPPQNDNGTPTGGGSGGNNSNTTPSANFAPVGSGNTLYAGTLAAGESMTLTQEFIVNVKIESGIQTLPISLRFRTENGETGQATLPASLLIVVPPRLQVDLQDPLPPTVNVGEPLPVTLIINNIGTTIEVLERAAVSTENGEVLEGATTPIGIIRADDDAQISAVLMPSAEGVLRFTFTLHYIDDLNEARTLDYTFSVDAVQPPEMPTPEFPLEPIPTPEPTPEPDDLLGDLLLGFLGLGG